MNNKDIVDLNWDLYEHKFSDDEIELFSSRGPTDDARTKPEICGPDRTSTSQILFNGGKGFFQPVLGNVCERDLEAVLGKYVGDSVSHGAGADNCDVLHVWGIMGC